MTSENSALDAAAAGLAAAWLEGRQDEGLRALVRPATLYEAYGIQDRLASLIGQSTVGWKIGMAGRKAYLGAGLKRPVFGRVFGRRLYRDGDVVPVPKGVQVTIELELALVLEQVVDKRDGTVLEWSAHLGFEIVSSRLPDRQSIGIPATVADNAVSHAVVLGGRIDSTDIASIAPSAVIEADGRIATSSLTGDDLPEAASVFGELVAHLRERGQELEAGDVVFTGTLTKPFDVSAPCDLLGSCGGSTVRCRLVPEP